MILERVEKEGNVDVLYDSSNIVASSYNKNTKDLKITFKNGGSYTYQNVPETDYMRFETADSQGKALNTQIKKYPFLKHDPVDISEVTDKIKKMKNEELTELKMGILNASKDLVSNYEVTGDVNNQIINDIESLIMIYKRSL